MSTKRRDTSIGPRRVAWLAALLLAMPLAATAQSAPAPAGSTAPVAMDHGPMHGMDHGGMHHGTPPPAPATSPQVMPDMDHASMPGMSHGQAHGAGAGMQPMQGGYAPADARSGDYSDGIAASPAHALHMHGSTPAGMLLIDQLEAFHGRDGNGQSWEASGWYGSDTDKLWLRSEGERSDGRIGDGEVEALWDHAAAAFWSTQLGVRHDFGTGPQRSWAAFGVQGLAPYWFEIQATAYVGPSGRSAARLRADYELLFTQRLILQPELEVNLHGKSDPARGIGSGLTDARLGLRLRYEIRREFAPYLGVVWTRRFGTTADFARADHQAVFDRQWVAGLRIWF
jgi:copper resistance protein B